MESKDRTNKVDDMTQEVKMNPGGHEHEVNPTKRIRYDSKVWLNDFLIFL